MRASNLAIGAVTLAVIAAAFTALLAVQKLRSAQSKSPIRIVFDGGSAAGLRRGGPVNFDGVQSGEIISIKLENPRKIVVLAMLDNSAPIRKDTAVGIEFEGLTGVADIALVGGTAAAPPAPLDADGVPVLTADWSEQQSITDTLHNVDNFLLGNRQTIKDSLLSFETYTASLKNKGEAVDDILARVDDSFAGFDSTMARINNAIPGFADGKADELFEKLRSLREVADTYKQKSATFLEDGRRMLSDVSEGANNFARKIDPQSAPVAAPPRRAAPKRQ